MKRFAKFLDQYHKVIAGAFLGLFVIFSVASVWNDAQSMDEAVHLSAGYSYLETRDYRLNPEHPALMKIIAGMPLFLLDLEFPHNSESWISAEQWGFGSTFVYENTTHADTIMKFGRFPTIILSLLVGVFVFKWAKELFGPRGAILATLLFAFDATFIAHSHYVTTDAAAAFGFLTTVYAYYNYLRTHERRWFWWAVVAMVAALLLKYSTVILLPMLVMLWAVKRWQDAGTGKHHSLKTFFGYWFAVLGAFLIFSIPVYGFNFTKPIDSPDSQIVIQQLEDIRAEANPLEAAPGMLPAIAVALDPDKPLGSFFYNTVINTPIPAWDYYRGMISVFLHNTYGHASYLMGNHANSFWNYFIVAFFVKTPAPTLILIGLSLFYVFARLTSRVVYKNKGAAQKTTWYSRLYRAAKAVPLAYWAIWIAVGLYFLWSLTARINLGVRHLLPIYPFLFVFVGVLTTLKLKPGSQKVFNWCLGGLLGIYVALSVAIFPHYLSYFNVFVGGASEGHQYLLDSNVEWGQDLKRLKTYLDENGETGPVYLQYFGTARPDYYGIESSTPPKNVTESEPVLDRLVILSVDAILASDDDYEWVLNHNPVDRVGYSFYIYDFRP